jgi:hypothetical protein
MMKIMYACLLVALAAGCDPVHSVSQTPAKKPQQAAAAPPKKVKVG